MVIQFIIPYDYAKLQTSFTCQGIMLALSCELRTRSYCWLTTRREYMSWNPVSRVPWTACNPWFSQSRSVTMSLG